MQREIQDGVSAQTVDNECALRWVQILKRLNDLDRQLDFLDASLRRDFPTPTPTPTPTPAHLASVAPVITSPIGITDS